LFDYIKNLLYDPRKAVLDPEQLPEGFRDLGKGLLYLGHCVGEVRDFSRAISKGDLENVPVAQGNELASGLKSLHASLKHLTWQMQQVAKGDYTQHVSFMGEFSEAVNDMVKQLEERYTALSDEIEISQQKTEALLQSNSLFEAITNNISQWIVMIDRENGEWLFSNHKVENVLMNLESTTHLHRWLGHQVEDVHPHSSDDPLELALDFEGGTQYFSVATYPILWHGHDAVAFVLSDVTLERRRLDSLENIAYVDELTEAYNRHYGMNKLNTWLEEGEGFVICFIDMDNLKFVNDEYGHREGDTYILCVSAMLKLFANNVIICRLGGDEFMMLCKGWNLGSAEERLEGLRTNLMEHSEPAVEYNRSISYGVIEVTAENTLPASELLSLADEKMYAYKRAHKMQRASTV